MSEMNFSDFDAVLAAGMDDLMDLPPMGVPPSGHYNLDVTAERVKGKDGKPDYVKFEYVVTSINELAEGSDESEVKAGQKFTEMFSPIKKDGTVNEMGIGFLKERLKPFAAHFNTAGVGETMSNIQAVTIAASLVRVPAKKEGERDGMRLDNVVLL